MFLGCFIQFGLFFLFFVVFLLLRYGRSTSRSEKFYLRLENIDFFRVCALACVQLIRLRLSWLLFFFAYVPFFLCILHSDFLPFFIFHCCHLLFHTLFVQRSCNAWKKQVSQSIACMQMSYWSVNFDFSIIVNYFRLFLFVSSCAILHNNMVIWCHVYDTCSYLTRIQQQQQKTFCFELTSLPKL